MAWHIIVERVLSALIADEFRLFNGGVKKDDQGYYVLRVKKSFYGLSVLFLAISLFCIYMAIFYVKPNEFILAWCICAGFSAITVLWTLTVRNSYIRYNEAEIIKQDLFKRKKSILWVNCRFKPMNIWSRSLVLYDTNTRILVNDGYEGYNTLLYQIEKKLKVSRIQLGVPMM